MDVNLPPMICQSRTDGFLPIRFDQWTRGAECFKSNNKQDDCLKATDCIEEDGNYCLKFRDGRRTGNGQDLGTVMFYRKVTIDDPSYWNIDLPGGTTTWAILTAVTNVNEQRPIVSTSVTSCDRASKSVFPSVFGGENDVLLLSQSFDDTALIGDFKPPTGTSLLGWTRSEDEVSDVRLLLLLHRESCNNLKMTVLLTAYSQGWIPLPREARPNRTDRNAHHQRSWRFKVQG